jgi:formate dehydrogenase major subunit
MLEITVNGKKIELEKSDTILNVAKSLGIDIPTFCNDDRLIPHAACRICVVEVVGARNLPTACSTFVTNGMEIFTHTEKVVKARRKILDLILANHPLDCLTCTKAGNCNLQNYCFEYDIKESTFKSEPKPKGIETENKFYDYDSEKCILCGKCERVCNLLQVSNVINYKDRGFFTDICRFSEYEDSCVSCGNCISVCPVGALTPKTNEKFRSWDIKTVKTTCPYCGVGCQMYLQVKGDTVVGVEPAYEKPNSGLLCVKGKFGYNFINHPDRLKTPLIKKSGKFVEATWSEAFEVIIENIKKTKKDFGADFFAGLASARCTNEENYLFQKMFRAVIGTNNVDHCARLCHASTVAGLATTLGSGAMTNSIEEILDTNVIFITGSNTTESHPVIGAKVKQAKLRGAKIIVAEPRKIEMADYADIFLQIKPGTNVALFNGMMNIILSEGLQDTEYIKSRTENFEDLEKIIKEYTPEKVSKICGISVEDLINATRLYANADKATILYSMGVTQHTTGTEGVMSISNLALLCGNIGKESTGVNPLRGQNNVQGACDMGALPNVYPGYQQVVDEKFKAKFESAWNCKLDNKIGYTLSDIINQAEKGNIKFLYIMGENPMISDPDLNHVHEALETVDFLVVQDIFLTETAELADVVLPAVTFAEKEGTFTNTERKVQRVRKAINTVGDAKTDSEILIELMNKLGYETKYDSASDIMDEISKLTPQYGGISYERIDSEGLHWPCPTKEHAGTKCLHKEVFTRGKGLFKPAEYKESAELTDNEYDLLLTTGRILYHYHTRTMTGKVAGLNAISSTSYIEVNPKTANRLNVVDGEKVTVTSRRGKIESKIKITDVIKENVVFMPFHFADGATNYLTNNALDPIAKIPELKVCAVKIEKINV